MSLPAIQQSGPGQTGSPETILLITHPLNPSLDVPHLELTSPVVGQLTIARKNTILHAELNPCHTIGPLRVALPLTRPRLRPAPGIIHSQPLGPLWRTHTYVKRYRISNLMTTCGLISIVWMFRAAGLLEVRLLDAHM
jgi:hypothetical protein